jgi:hypothetical protein
MLKSGAEQQLSQRPMKQMSWSLVRASQVSAAR